MISEKELYDRGECLGSFNCNDCPFYNTPIEKSIRKELPNVCYKTFKDHYEKQLVIDYVLGDSNE